MGVSNTVYQQKHNVSIPRDGIKDIAEDLDLSKTDLRVMLVLLTELNGYSKDDNTTSKPDPLNFKLIDMDSISDFLNIKHKEVKKSIRKFLDLGFIEKGSSESISCGYRFTF